MEHFPLKKTERGLHIEGFPDAVKVLRITGPKSRRLADLSLHKADLDFALECLAAINEIPEEPLALRQALWRSAIVYFAKCFGQSKSRFSLDKGNIYKSDSEAIEVYNYFSSLRNKHIIHDENSYAQSHPGAILNKVGMDYKIAKIVCLGLFGDTLNQESYANLHKLISQARDWVVLEFDKLCDILTSEFENMPYDELLKIEEIKCAVPSATDIHKTRLP